jgi:hypothetical protein
MSNALYFAISFKNVYYSYEIAYSSAPLVGMSHFKYKEFFPLKNNKYFSFYTGINKYIYIKAFQTNNGFERVSQYLKDAKGAH